MNTVHISVHPNSKLAQDVTIGAHRLVADEKAPAGEDLGPEPFEWLLAALGNCTAFTLRMYAQRKAWPLEDVKVELDGNKTDDGKFHIKRRVQLKGPLDAEQTKRLMEIAERCPVHRAWSQPTEIVTSAI